MSAVTAVREPTIGILYPGELGSRIGKELIKEGRRVATTLEGRSARTCALCRESKIREMDTFGDVVNAADVVISLVHPGSAVEVAERFTRHLHPPASAAKIYVDANSVSPETAEQVGRIVGARGARFCDATIQGPANRLTEMATLYLSGDAANEIENLFTGILRTRMLGAVGGRASAMKMLLAGLTKGLTALFLELSVLAQRSELSDDFLDECEQSYPAVMEVLRRMLPTVPQHAGRRAEEMTELASFERKMDVSNVFAPFARDVFLDIAASELKTRWQTAPQHAREFRALVDMITQALAREYELAAKCTL